MSEREKSGKFSKYLCVKCMVLCIFLAQMKNQQPHSLKNKTIKNALCVHT